MYIRLAKSKLYGYYKNMLTIDINTRIPML